MCTFANSDCYQLEHSPLTSTQWDIRYIFVDGDREKSFSGHFQSPIKCNQIHCEGGGNISIISDRIINRNCKKAILHVKDTGRGIENEMLHKLF